MLLKKESPQMKIVRNSQMKSAHIDLHECSWKRKPADPQGNQPDNGYCSYWGGTQTCEKSIQSINKKLVVASFTKWFQ